MPGNDVGTQIASCHGCHKFILNSTGMDEEEDELDRLTRSFEAQASKDLEKASTHTVKPKLKRKNMKEIRDDGLKAHLPEDSK